MNVLNPQYMGEITPKNEGFEFPWYIYILQIFNTYDQRAVEKIGAARLVHHLTRELIGSISGQNLPTPWKTNMSPEN